MFNSKRIEALERKFNRVFSKKKTPDFFSSIMFSIEDNRTLEDRIVSLENANRMLMNYLDLMVDHKTGPTIVKKPKEKNHD